MEKTNANKGLYIQLYSIHGLIRSNNLELGRDADTGGQTKYVVELAGALSKHPEVGRIELVTRLIKDKKVSEDYSKHVEIVNPKFSIIRIPCGGGKYIRKELLWDHLEEFVDKSIKYIKSVGKLPDIIHSHYVDAGFVCAELNKIFGIPFIHTGHSLGKLKLENLLEQNLTKEQIEKQYRLSHRIKVEESILQYSDLIITSTSDEVTKQYGVYKNKDLAKFIVIPPGIDLEKFFPYKEERIWNEDAKIIRKRIRDELLRFFSVMNKPLILSICRADKRKNISGLINAYGENKELQEIANLAIFAGIRKDIQTMPDNEREVLTEILLLMDKYDLYGKMAVPKKHDVEFEVPELYRIAAETKGVFVNPSFSENFGITLIEAAASGLPTVSTNLGGPRDIVKNLKAGLLIGVNDIQNISNAIKRILKEGKIWHTLSANGIKNIGKTYSWSAHTKKYLSEIKKILGEAKDERRTFSMLGKKLIDAKKMLIVDIDNTLLGDEESLLALQKVIKQNQSLAGFGVATGRTLDSAVEVLGKNISIKPDFYITSVGAEIYYYNRKKLIPSTGWESHISRSWDRNKIIELLIGFDSLKYQEEENQREFKISYYFKGNAKELEAIRHRLISNRIKCNLIFSHQRFIDILPFRASKGRAIRYLAYRWNIPHDSILVSGDSGNDEDMLKGELLGVVVGNRSIELDKLKGRRKIYFAERPFAAGILEGIEYYNFFSD